MHSLLTYVLYALVFVATILAVEGGWLALRGLAGRERAINQRLGKARRAATGIPSPAESPLDLWVDARLPWLARNLDRARAPIKPAVVIFMAVGLTVAVGMGLSFLQAPAIVALAAGLLVGLGGPLALIRIAAGRRQSRFLDQLPQAVDLIARSLQAGHPVTGAMAVVAQQMPDPIGPEFGQVIEEMTYGLDRDEALQNLLKRFPIAELRMFVASLEVTRESGGNLAEVFINLAAAIRAKAMLRKKVEAISAEGRLSFWVVSCLPIAVVGLIMIMRPSYYRDVAGDPLFWPMMAVSPIMLAIGATVIWRMVNLKI